MSRDTGILTRGHLPMSGIWCSLSLGPHSDILVPLCICYPDPCGIDIESAANDQNQGNNEESGAERPHCVGH